MPTFDPSRISKPSALRKIDTQNLLDFLQPYTDYLKLCGFTLPATSTARFDYEALSRILLDCAEDAPVGLTGALYYVDELSTQEGFDAIQEAIENHHLSIEVNQNITPADLAIKLWICDKALAEQIHAEQFLKNPRGFRCFSSSFTHVPYQPMSKAALTNMESELNDWFEAKRRGRTAKVFVYDKTDNVWFLIRHGGPYTREPSIDASNNDCCTFFRPMKYDVALYCPRTNEIRVNAKSKGACKLYRQKIGKYCFNGFEDYFDRESHFTLNPLYENGSDALLCSDIEGIDKVTLTEIRFQSSGAYSEIEIRKADDVFAAYASRSKLLLQTKGLYRASFSVKFTDSKTPRTVTICGNEAKYKRDSDSEILEKWFEARGFVVSIKARDEQLSILDDNRKYRSADCSIA